MTDRLPINASLAEVYAWYCSLFPPPQCAPALGVHQGCEHAEQSRPRAHFTVEQGGTCTRNNRLVQSPRQAELAPSTVTPPADAPGITWDDVQAMRQRVEAAAQQSPATGSHPTSDH